VEAGLPNPYGYSSYKKSHEKLYEPISGFGKANL
jgi:hypothetical protein